MRSSFSISRSRTLVLGLCLQVLLLMATLQSFAAAADEPSIAGQVELVDGDVQIIDLTGAVRVPKVEDKVFEGETLQSGMSGALHVRMQDHGFIAVRANTQLEITRYQAKGTDSDSVVFSLIKGTFRSITGWVGKLNRKNYKVQTQNATLGIRGTDHEPLFVPESNAGDADANPPGTYDKVNSGATFIENSFGKVEVSPEKVGFAPLVGKPRLLSTVPAFYLRTKHEGRIEERKEQLRRNILDKLRDAPRKAGTGEDGQDGSKREQVIERLRKGIDNDDDPPAIKPRRERHRRLTHPKP